MPRQDVPIKWATDVRNQLTGFNCVTPRRKQSQLLRIDEINGQRTAHFWKEQVNPPPPRSKHIYPVVPDRHIGILHQLQYDNKKFKFPQIFCLASTVQKRRFRREILLISADIARYFSGMLLASVSVVHCRPCRGRCHRRPVSWIFEMNAPPSQKLWFELLF